MKKVMDKSDVAHFWANKLQSEARDSHGNFYFEGDTIYSYGRHFPIAKHVENEQSEQVILFTERRYSNTTAKHIAIVRQAANHKRTIYCNSPGDMHSSNFTAWQREAESVATKLPKAKKPEKYLNEIEHIGSKAKKYADFFNLEIPDTLKIILSISNKEEYSQYNDRKEQAAKETEARAKAELKARHKKELAAWLAGKSDRLYVRDGFDYLRINGDKVETSQGIDMSIEYALFIYRKLKADRLKIGDKVLSYEVSKMNGVVTIGCHNFKKSYLLSFGSKLEKLPSVTS